MENNQAINSALHVNENIEGSYDPWEDTTLKFEIPLAEAKEIHSVWKNNSTDGYTGWDPIVYSDEIIGIRKQFSNEIRFESRNNFDDDSECFLVIHDGRVRIKVAMISLGGSPGSWRLLIYTDTDFESGIILEAV